MFGNDHHSADDLAEEINSLKQFIAKRDASAVHEACSGIGTDEKLLVDVLCGRTKTQLESIDQAYREKYNKSLWAELRSDLGGNYERIVQYALMQRDEYVAHVLHDACSGFGTDESLLIEVLTPLTNEEIETARTFYEEKHGKSLVDRIKSEISGSLEKLILKMVRGERDECEEADEGLAAEQVAQLHAAGIGKRSGTDDDVFINIIGKSSRAQIQAVKTLYEDTHGMSLRRAIGKEFRGDVRVALQGLLEAPMDYQCTVLRNAAKGLGTNEKAICRVLGSHDKHQVAMIAARFAEKYDKTLAEVVDEELNGDFKLAVAKWIDPLADPTCGVEQRLEVLMRTSGDPDERLELLREEYNNLKGHIIKSDAKAIRRACKGVGTDENLLIDILCNRTKSQVEQIDQAYREEFDIPLRKPLEKDLGGNLKKFMVYTQMESDEFAGLQMRDAMQGLGTDEDILISILTTRSNADIEAAQRFYEGRFDESLVDKVAEEMSGLLQTLVLKLLRAERDESTDVDRRDAKRQADELQEAEDKCVFVDLLTSVSAAQARCIAEAYEERHGKALGDVIMRKFSGDVEDALLALLFDPIENSARVLKKAFHGFGTDEDTVCRILGGNDKDTCLKIAEKYEEKYEMPLTEALKKDLGGKFRRAAVKWVSPCELVFESAEDYGDQGHGYGEEPEDIEGQLSSKYDDDRKHDRFGFGFMSSWFSRGIEEEDNEEEFGEHCAAKEEAKQAEIRRTRGRLNKSREVAMEMSERDAQYNESKAFVEQARMAASNAREQVFAAKEKYGNDVVSGMKVYGKWDPDLYLKHNDDVEDDPWEHYQSTGFGEGRLFRVDNDCGAFVGIPDFAATARVNGVDLEMEQAPYEAQLVGMKYFGEEGKDAEHEVVITKVVPVYLCGVFSPELYARKYQDVRTMTSVPRPGKLDDEGYRRLHPEVEENELSVIDHYRENPRAKICVRGGVGLPNRKWYMATYEQESFEHYLNEGYDEGLPLLLQPNKTSSMSHFCQKGHTEGRCSTFRTPVGEFDGVFDEEKFLELNPEAAESGMGPLEYLESEGAGAKLPLVQVRMHKVLSQELASDRACEDVGEYVAQDWEDVDEVDEYEAEEDEYEDEE